MAASIFICAFACSHQLALWRLVEQGFKLRSAIFHFKFTSASPVLAIASVCIIQTLNASLSLSLSLGHVVPFSVNVHL